MPINVAIVDDDRKALEALRCGIEMGRRFACNGCFSSTAEALEGIPAGEFEVVLMGLSMPVISGIQCTRKLKSMLPELSVILVTGYLEPAVIFEALGAGASGYLARPVTASACRSAIDDVVNGGAPLCREAARLLLNFFKYATAVVADLPTVSGREKDIIACLVQGCSDREIAAQLGIGTATVHTHMHRMFGKLGVSDRHSAVSKYVGIRSRIPSRSRRERTPIFGP